MYLQHPLLMKQKKNYFYNKKKNYNYLQFDYFSIFFPDVIIPFERQKL